MTNTPTDTLARLRAAEQKASPAPWREERFGPDNAIVGISFLDVFPPHEPERLGVAYFCDHCGDGETEGIDRDPGAIVAMRNAFPALLDVVEAANELVEDAGIEMNDKRMSYIVAQICRTDWQRIRDALARLGEAT